MMKQKNPIEELRRTGVSGLDLYEKVVNDPTLYKEANKLGYPILVWKDIVVGIDEMWERQRALPKKALEREHKLPYPKDWKNDGNNTMYSTGDLIYKLASEEGKFFRYKGLTRLGNLKESGRDLALTEELVLLYSQNIEDRKITYIGTNIALTLLKIGYNEKTKPIFSKFMTSCLTDFKKLSFSHKEKLGRFLQRIEEDVLVYEDLIFGVWEEHYAHPNAVYGKLGILATIYEDLIKQLENYKKDRIIEEIIKSHVEA